MKLLTSRASFFKKYDITHQVKQALFCCFIFRFFKQGGYFCLCIYEIFKLIISVRSRIKVFSPYLIGSFFKDAFKNIPGDKRLAITIRIKWYIPRTEFGNVNRDGRYKPAHNTFCFIYRNAPYSKKTENMVNSKCVKIITHLVESPAPPIVIIFTHVAPVISGKAPVLAFYSKIIRRRT